MPTNRTRARRTPQGLLRPPQLAFLTGDMSHLTNKFQWFEVQDIANGATGSPGIEAMKNFKTAAQLLEEFPEYLNDLRLKKYRNPANWHPDAKISGAHTE